MKTMAPVGSPPGPDPEGTLLQVVQFVPPEDDSEIAEQYFKVELVVSNHNCPSPVTPFGAAWTAFGTGATNRTNNNSQAANI